MQDQTHHTQKLVVRERTLVSSVSPTGKIQWKLERYSLQGACQQFQIQTPRACHGLTQRDFSALKLLSPLNGDQIQNTVSPYQTVP